MSRVKFQMGDWVEPNAWLKMYLVKENAGQKFTRARVLACGPGWIDVLFTDAMHPLILDPDSFEIYLNGVDRMVECLK